MTRENEDLWQVGANYQDPLDPWDFQLAGWELLQEQCEEAGAKPARAHRSRPVKRPRRQTREDPNGWE